MWEICSRLLKSPYCLTAIFTVKKLELGKRGTVYSIITVFPPSKIPFYASELYCVIFLLSVLTWMECFNASASPAAFSMVVASSKPSSVPIKLISLCTA